MVAKTITIRNLTATPIALKHIERFSPPEKHNAGWLDTLTKNVTQTLTNATKTDEPAAALSIDAHPFTQEGVDIHIDPFKTAKTDCHAFIKDDKERLRLTFEATGGERHRVQIPVPTTESETMEALVENPRFRFTGVYVRPESFLAVYSSANLHSWMKEIKDEVLLSSLSIPGTHNSPACHVSLPSVRCQAVGPREQLENGIRFFDLRVQPQFPNNPNRDELLLVHGVFPIALAGVKCFRDLMSEINEFLNEHPSETLIVSVKREGPGEHTDEQLSRILRDHYITPDSRWFTEPKIPTLGEARGKMVLVRRFDVEDRLEGEHGGRGWGIDAAGWADNTPHAVCPSGQICVQDFYEVLETRNIDKKIQCVTDQVCRSCGTCYPFGVNAPEASKEHPFFVNFLSASNFWRWGTWPEKIAAKLNPTVVDYLCRKHGGKDGDWSTGIIVSDWVGWNGDWDLVRCVVGMNARLLLR